MGRAEEPEPDISKATVAVLETSTSHDYVRRHGLGAKVLTYENTSDLPIAVSSGEANVAVIMSTVLNNYVRSGQYPVKSLRQSLVFESWGIGVRKGNEQLREFLNNHLRMMVDEGTIIAAAGAITLP